VTTFSQSAGDVNGSLSHEPEAYDVDDHGQNNQRQAPRPIAISFLHRAFSTWVSSGGSANQPEPKRGPATVPAVDSPEVATMPMIVEVISVALVLVIVSTSP